MSTATKDTDRLAAAHQALSDAIAWKLFHDAD